MFDSTLKTNRVHVNHHNPEAKHVDKLESLISNSTVLESLCVCWKDTSAHTAVELVESALAVFLPAGWLNY